MKFKTVLLSLTAAALLASCNNADALSSLLPTSGDPTSSPVSSDQGGQGQTSGKTSTTSKTSTTTPVTSQGGNTSASTGESVDLDGYVEEAWAPEGVVLTDWTDEMKAILQKYLGGNLPPFVYMSNLGVTYDNMDYLKVVGTINANTVYNYELALQNAGWEGYEQTTANGVEIISRKILDNGVLEGDALVNETTDYFSCIYTYTPSTSEWPAGYFDFALDEYGSKAVVPVLEATSYIAQIGYLYDVNVFCMGIDASSLPAYAQLLTENRWTVTTKVEGGTTVYEADSLDKLAKLTIYFDGTLVTIIMEHGNGEIFTTWDDCLPAIDDFVTYDLRLSSGISSILPEVADGLQYTIDRSINGRLFIKALKNTSYSLNDVINYRIALAAIEGFTVVEKAFEEEYIVWAYPADHSYAICVELADYYSELGDHSYYLQISINDYRIYAGYSVSSAWPTSQVATIVGIVAPGTLVPGYEMEGATYYTKSNYTDEVEIQIVNPGEDPVNTYKEGLEDSYGYTSTVSGNGYLSIDRKKGVQIQYEMVGNEFHIVIRKYVKPAVIEGDTATLVFSNDAISNNDKGWWWDVTFGTTPFSVRVEKNTTTVTVGNQGVYLSPLRLFTNQKITITPSEGYELTQLDFYTVTVSATGSFKNNNAANLSAISIEGATLVGEFNSNTGLTRYSIDSTHAQTGISFVVEGNFALEEIVATVAAI